MIVQNCCCFRSITKKRLVFIVHEMIHQFRSHKTVVQIFQFRFMMVFFCGGQTKKSFYLNGVHVLRIKVKCQSHVRTPIGQIKSHPSVKQSSYIRYLYNEWPSSAKAKEQLVEGQQQQKVGTLIQFDLMMKRNHDKWKHKEKTASAPPQNNYFQLLLTIPNYITFQNKKGQIDDTKVFLMVCCPKGFREGLLLLLLKTVISLGYTYFLTSSYMSQLRSTKMLERKPSKNNALHLQG